MLLGRSYFALRTVYRRASSVANSVSHKVKKCPTKTVMKAYIRTKNEERVDIQFQYVDSNLGLDRWFNFNRSLDDSVQQIKERIIANIDKACQKYKKRKLKKNPTGDMDEFKLDVEVMQNSEIIAPEVPCRKILTMPNVFIVVNGQSYHLDINPPTVKTLKLPNSIMAGYPVYPSKLEVEYCTVFDCEFLWFKTNELVDMAPEAHSENWIQVGTGFSYTTSNCDIGNWLKVKCIPKTSSKIGLPECAIASQVVEAGPGICPFEIRHNFTNKFVENDGFRVVTYNILADLYADSDYTRTVLHPYCPPYALAIDYRKQLILKELLGYKADIICLQEVDSKVFDADLKPIFSSYGFESEFSKKGGQVSEGMACIFNASKFQLVQSSSHIVAEELSSNPLVADLWVAVQKNENLSKRILERTTSCQLLVLESVFNAKRIVVANTHLYFHPDADHIRLLQSCVTLRLAQEMRNRQLDLGKEVSLLFCGDFNSCPGSGVFEMMTLQNIDCDNEAWSSKPDEAVIDLSLHNPIAMETACGTPPFTNYTSGFSGCLDYIFFEKSKFIVEQVVPLPSVEEVTQHCALPSIVFPSDHIALIADLKWV